MRRRSFGWLLILLCLATWASEAPAQTAPKIVRVEEDWELVVGEADPAINAPQITTVISPVCTVDWLHAAFELNGQSLPEFVAGGMQLQLWDGEKPVTEQKYPAPEELAQPGEVVSWTQCMEVGDGQLTFEIINGHSTTWGNFGGQGYLKTSICFPQDDLEYYDPYVSVANSGVGYAANRVQSLALKRVRIFLSTGEQWEDTTPRIVHCQE